MCLGPTCKSTGTAIAFQRAFQTNHVNKPSKNTSNEEDLALIRTVKLSQEGNHFVGDGSLRSALENLVKKKYPELLPSKYEFRKDEYHIYTLNSERVKRLLPKLEEAIRKKNDMRPRENCNLPSCCIS